MTITLYETNSEILVVANGDQAWSFIAWGEDMRGKFAADAAAWAAGDWAPNEGDGQSPTFVDDKLREVATWDAEQGLQVLVKPYELGGAARDYLGVHPED
ncbi:hypothetical protein [Nonomuraea wenchangensis]|uniref:Uncharacterized protein n=1 Tax=Nonomuraea wenchangensis TaxID=568860 RepID=A0A1I0LTQ7_9ACTN|nr:hypothetical protein [Nonomuraea wenchangensis]SEU46500.1 hypothetical protein SAMN05421811_12754 [Nonomuraea wenchangensis]